MLPQHWVLIVVTLVIGYVVGVKYPGWGRQIGL